MLIITDYLKEDSYRKVKYRKNYFKFRKWIHKNNWWTTYIYRNKDLYYLYSCEFNLRISTNDKTLIQYGNIIKALFGYHYEPIKMKYKIRYFKNVCLANDPELFLKYVKIFPEVISETTLQMIINCYYEFRTLEFLEFYKKYYPDFNVKDNIEYHKSCFLHKIIYKKNMYYRIKDYIIKTIYFNKRFEDIKIYEDQIWVDILLYCSKYYLYYYYENINAEYLINYLIINSSNSFLTLFKQYPKAIDKFYKLFYENQTNDVNESISNSSSKIKYLKASLEIKSEKLEKHYKEVYQKYLGFRNDFIDTFLLRFEPTEEILENVLKNYYKHYSIFNNSQKLFEIAVKLIKSGFKFDLGNFYNNYNQLFKYYDPDFIKYFYNLFIEKLKKSGSYSITKYILILKQCIKIIPEKQIADDLIEYCEHFLNELQCIKIICKFHKQQVSEIIFQKILQNNISYNLLEQLFSEINFRNEFANHPKCKNLIASIVISNHKEVLQHIINIDEHQDYISKIIARHNEIQKKMHIRFKDPGPRYPNFRY